MKRFGHISTLVGALSLGVGLVLLLAIVPGLKQFPDDVDENIVYEGTMGVLFNPTALASNDLPNLFLRDLPVTIDRQVTVLETSGGEALVQDTQDLVGPTGPIQNSEKLFTIDRKTMGHVPNFTDDDRVLDRQGLVVGFPIGTEGQTYEGWNGDAEAVNSITYVQESEVTGLQALEFSASSGPDPITNPVVLSALPPALPKAVLGALVPSLGLPADAAGQLAAVLETMPDPVPLSYVYSYETRYWVEPDTGVVLDYNKSETRTVGLTVQDNFVPLTDVWDLSFEQSDASVEEAISRAEDGQSSLFWLGRALPWTLIIGGIILGLVGLGLTFGRKDRDGVNQSGVSEGPAEVDLRTSKYSEDLVSGSSAGSSIRS
jgi:hypothetical protein